MSPERAEKAIVNSYFNSKTDEEIALNMSRVIAKLINRDLDNIEGKNESEEAMTISI